MGFQVTYPAGGVIDQVRRVDLPRHLFPSYGQPFIKGLRLSVPPLVGMFSITYAVPVKMELLGLEVGCTGYADVDSWDFSVGNRLVCESIYTKEVAQTKWLGVLPVEAGTVLRLDFHNDSGTSKVVWVDLNFARPD